MTTKTPNYLKPTTPRLLLSALIGLVICFSLILSGCSNTMLPEYYKWAEAMCEGNEGVNEITTLGFLLPELKCNNGALFQLTNNVDLGVYR